MTKKNKCRAFLGFGGNLGEPLNHFRHARQKLAEHPQVEVISASPLYQTPPVGGPEGQPDYLNAAIEILTGLSALDLLQLCHQIEADAGRSRTLHWGARTLDIDLLLVDDLIMDGPLLTLPHPRLHQRHFVLIPLNDIAPGQLHPLLNTTISQVLRALPPAVGITRLN